MASQRTRKHLPCPAGNQEVDALSGFFGTVFCSLEPGHVSFREPINGEWVVGLYRESDGTLCPILLWADPQIDLFWDPSLRRHVKPPSAYLLLPNQPHLGSSTPSDVARPRQ